MEEQQYDINEGNRPIGWSSIVIQLTKNNDPNTRVIITLYGVSESELTDKYKAIREVVFQDWDNK